jgi:hypothetical protein
VIELVKKRAFLNGFLRGRVPLFEPSVIGARPISHRSGWIDCFVAGSNWFVIVRALAQVEAKETDIGAA